jgi:hypothetical protein
MSPFDSTVTALTAEVVWPGLALSVPPLPNEVSSAPAAE